VSTISNQPANQNFLSPLGFKFTINKTPSINYFVQNVTLPNLTLGQSNVPSPFIRIPLAGDHLEFGDLSVTFKVDENLDNYLEIFDWMIAMGFPDEFDEFKAIDERRGGVITGLTDRMTGHGIYSDATLTILSSAMNPLHQITFIEAFPTSLSEIPFSSTESDVVHASATVTFAFRRFKIARL